MKHLSAGQLGARHDGELAGRELEAADRHLAACPSCREALAHLSAQDARLRPALTYDPGAAYFDTFAARVEDRLRAAGLKGAQARLGGGGPWAWLRSPRRVAWAGAVAAIVAGAGIVTLTVREVDQPGLRREWTETRPAPLVPDRKAAGSPAAKKEAGEAFLERGVVRPPARTRDREFARPAPPEPGSHEAGMPSTLERQAPDPAAHETMDLPEAKGTPIAPVDQKATPGRLRKVNRTSAGEDVPVASEEFRFASPPAAATPATGSPTRAPQQRGARPLEGRAQPTFESGPKLAGGTRTSELRLCGHVLDPAGRPVVGAQVVLADNSRIAKTDATGAFCLSSPPGQHDLTVMAVGFHPTRQPVRVTGESSATTVTLQPVSVLDQASRTRSPSEALRGTAQGREAGDVSTPTNRAFSGLPDSLRAAVQSAERFSAAAKDLGLASAFDGAADAWGRVSDVLPPGPPRVAARFAMASARYGAWVNRRTESRKRAARSALTSFLEVAPPGPERTEAQRWLKHLGR